MLTTVYLINRTPTSVLCGQTPYEVLFKEKPSYDHIKIFESLCYAYKLQRHKDKLEKGVGRVFFVGYPFGKQGWNIYNLEKSEMFDTRNVLFHEEIFHSLNLRHKEIIFLMKFLVTQEMGYLMIIG